MTWYNDSNTLSGLLRSLARNGLLPAQQSLFPTLDFMEMLGEETLSRVVPFIVSLNEGYFLKSIWYSIIPSNSQLLSTSPGTGGFAGSPSPRYNFPPDAVGRRLHDVSVFWGNSPRQESLVQVTDYQAGHMHNRGRGVYVDGDQFTLYPAVDFQNATNMRLSYRGQPLPLCDDSGTRTDGPTGAQIQTLVFLDATDSTPALYQAIMPAAAAAIATWPAEYPVNVIGGDPGFATQATISTYSVDGAGTLFFLASDLQDAYGQPLAAVNDWVADAGYSPVLQVPREAAQMAIYAVLSKALKAMGNEQYAVHEKTYLDLQEAAKTTFAPRIDDSPKILSSARRGRGGGWFY